VKADPLKKIPLFTRLSEPERRKIASEVVETSYKKGEYIFREGEPADTFHILKSGTVKCVKTSTEGKEVTLKVLMPGDLFCCDAAVLDGAFHPGCAQPLDDVQILALSKSAYFDMLRRNPDAALEVIQYLGKRLYEAQETNKVLALNQADQRLAALFVNLASRVGVQEGTGIRLPIRLTRQDLANMVGITVETAIRIMSRFKRQRLVSGTARSLVIRDLTRLQHLADPSPSAKG
jgi:CRP/FNR family transcriptional regulator